MNLGTARTPDLLTMLAPDRHAGVLEAGDVYVAEALCRLTGETRPHVVLAAALAARAPRLANAGVDLAHIAQLVTERDPVIAQQWPEPARWVLDVTSSPLVQGPEAPLVLDGSVLYLQRYRRYELDVAEQLLTRAQAPVPVIVPRADVVDVLLSGEGSEMQRRAVEVALGGALTVLVGGPGTGKTTTVAAVLASLAASDPALRVALAAPTGKAATRLGEALRLAASRLPTPLEHLAETLAAAEASTLHRLLGVRGGVGTSFHHHRGQPLPHDVVIVDETSMVSLPLMARLLDALRPDARLVLVGDADQLVSVEAGTVLGDIAGPAADPTAPRSGGTAPLARSVAVLQVSRRFPPGSSIDRLAAAVRRGDGDSALQVLAEGDDALHWDARLGDDPDARAQVLALAQAPSLAVLSRAEESDATGALAAIESFRILCAHRHGPFGVQRWNQLVERQLAAAGHDVTGWYVGRPVLVTANDYVNGLFNGDLGVVVRSDPRPVVAFPAFDQPHLINPSRLQAVDTVHATTIHKSQGSEFDHVVVVLPPADSPLATRELVYTAITRARQRVTVVGDEAAVRAAVARRVVRTGGLRAALWPETGR
jgi:exodeoxyribonuclease V alpha subunit